MNFCHLDDAIGFVLAALERAPAGAVLHGSDAHPARRREVIEWIAARLAIPAPRSARPFAGPDRRIRSALTRAALGVELRWPSFSDGLAALVPPP
jgi:nucleoside-diphosphate-sugar epimerase